MYCISNWYVTIYFVNPSHNILHIQHTTYYRYHKMKLIEIVSHPAFILSANAGNMYKSILSVVTTLTGVTVPTLEVQIEVNKLSKEFASRVKKKKWGKQGFLKWDQDYLFRREINLRSQSPEKVKQIDDYY